MDLILEGLCKGWSEHTLWSCDKWLAFEGMNLNPVVVFVVFVKAHLSTKKEHSQKR